jgi:hypothetical protein
MQPIINYYDLIIALDERVNTPLSFYCSFQKNISIASVIFENGLFKSIMFDTFEKNPSLDSEDQETATKIIHQNLNTLIKKWVDFHLYKKSVTDELLKGKL